MILRNRRDDSGDHQIDLAILKRAVGSINNPMTDDAWMSFRKPVDNGGYQSGAERGGGGDPYFTGGGVR